MKLLISQKNKLADLVLASNYSLDSFKFLEDEIDGTAIVLQSDENLIFNIRNSIQGAEFGDIFYRPTTKQACGHIYLPINCFEDLLTYFQEWLNCISLEISIEDKWSKTK